ncbi:Spy/CpxP family protein refolding chaperone [Phenylobacterium sp.]|uniref:Spy/CpxP family protein refolding chaperone n=1 Tax=Phenylobacterium sp. TaxID=1871053 RepID=UPI0012053B08|nr:Spy/CpxP family protein refolding chaperone [Phenylobacterium sp.]THD57820.1 MAG: hypothetical protein E8A49_21715 [Phenylobacterium sp.]
MRRATRYAALSALAVLGAATLATPAAWAQDGQRGPRPAAAGDMHARMQAMREAHEKQRAQDLRTILRLRPDQEPALTAFLQSHHRPDGAGKPGGRHGPPGAPGAGPGAAPMTTAQRLDMEARREAEMSGMRQRHAEALRTFYNALSPDQKQVFDALQRVQGHGYGRGGWGHHGFGGHGFGGRGPGGGPPPGGPRDE